jgi:4-alpha-glucanotransferase
MIKRRASGILLHITSLPSAHGIGDLGPAAYKFADFLAEAKQSFWQVLPLNPLGTSSHNSPYSGLSAFAGNPLLISLEKLAEQGLLTQEQIAQHPAFAADKVDYAKVVEFKQHLFNTAYENFKKSPAPCEYGKFCEENSMWLDDFALFIALSEHFRQQSWNKWPEPVRDRSSDELTVMRERFKDRIGREKFLQYIFFKQWFALKDYCSQRGIQFLGDIPIYVDYDCADVWTHPNLFKLDDKKLPTAVSGVPPDYFSKTGQRWGNPVYNWEVSKKGHYQWWIERIGHNLKLFTSLRIDHFRGFVQYWEVPASEETAVKGKWVDGPGEDLFFALLKRFAYLPIIAEDLGLITPDVREFIRRFEFPGMKVLLFAFDTTLPRNLYAPHNITSNCVVYTGTHDNNTVRGWFEKEASEEDKKRFMHYLGHETKAETVHWDMIRLAMRSVGNTVIIPVQDILGLDGEARMNTPSVKENNWTWRLADGQLTKDLAKNLADMTHIYGRD